MSSAREVILPLPSPVVPAKHIRSTVLLSSVAAIREAGLGEAYMAALDPAHRELILGSVVGMWVPMDAALAHYRACESLGLSSDTAAAIGRSTFDRTSGTLLGTMVKMSRNAGVTPWTVLPLFQRFWMRGFDGGGIAVHKLGPKDAHIEGVGVAPNDFRYFRSAVRGLVTGVLELFCAKAYVRELAGVHRPPGGIHMRAQWA